MWVIFSTALIAFTLVIRQGVIIARNLRLSYEDYHWLQGSDDIFYPGDSQRRSPIRQLLYSVESCRHKKEEMVGAINVQLAVIMPKLEGYMGTISVIGSILPMLGLLGTVLGMINVFEVVAINGSGNPKAMAEGISQALLTTASGLIFAIPVIFLHHLLSKKYNELVLIIKQSAEMLVLKSATSEQDSPLC